MRNQKPVTSFSRLPQTTFLHKAQHILVCMTGNANFPNPDPDLTTVGDAINAYATALNNVPTKENTSLKYQLRRALTALLNQLAAYVLIAGGGDVAKYNSSGFSVTRVPQPVGVLPKPANFSAVPVYNNAIKLSLNKIYGATGYLFEYAATPVTGDTAWTAVNNSKTRCVIEGLTKGQEYAFRVSGIGTNPTIVYSDVITSYVL